MTKSNSSKTRREPRHPNHSHPSDFTTSSSSTYQSAPSTTNSYLQGRLPAQLSDYHKQLQRVEEENGRRLRALRENESKLKRGSSGAGNAGGNAQQTGTEKPVTWNSVRECLESFATVAPKENGRVGGGRGSELGGSNVKDKANEDRRWR